MLTEIRPYDRQQRIFYCFIFIQEFQSLKIKRLFQFLETAFHMKN